MWNPPSLSRQSPPKALEYDPPPRPENSQLSTFFGSPTYACFPKKVRRLKSCLEFGSSSTCHFLKTTVECGQGEKPASLPPWWAFSNCRCHLQVCVRGGSRRAFKMRIYSPPRIIHFVSDTLSSCISHEDAPENKMYCTWGKQFKFKVLRER